jgi:uncharacterized membrane protein
MPTRFKYGDAANHGINDAAESAGQRTANGTTLSVMTSSDAEADHLRPIALKQLEEARKFVAAAKLRLDDNNSVTPYAKHYFLTKDMFSAGELATVKTIVRKIEDGLSGNIWLKVGETRTRADVQAAKKNPPGGRVSQKALLDDGRRVAKSLARKYQNIIDVAPADGINGTARMGAIHIDKDVLGNALGIQTLIHEASHKFAGTVDHCYFSHEKPWGQILGNLTTSEKALNNADSFAFLLFLLGGGTKWAWAPGPKDLR